MAPSVTGSEVSVSRQSLTQAMLFFAAIMTLTACATPSLPYIAVTGDNSCIVDAAGARFSLPNQAPALAAHLRRLARRSQTALMSERPALARPGCWDEAVAAVRAAGFSRIGFFTDDPAPDPDARDT